MLRVGKTFRFVFIDDQKDPDDLIREKGVEAFRSVLSRSLPLWDVLWKRETDGHEVRTPDSQAELEQKLYALVRTIQDPAINTAFYRTSRMQLANLFWQVNRGPARNHKEADPNSFETISSFAARGSVRGCKKSFWGSRPIP